MRKIETNITINNYSDYATLIYTPSFLNSFKNRIKITDAILKLSIFDFNTQTQKYSVYFIDGNEQYLIDEFCNENNKTEIHINITEELQQWVYKSSSNLKFKILGVALNQSGNEVVFEYNNIKSFFESKSTHNFDIQRAGNVELDLVSGMYNLTHFDLSCSSGSLPINISHCYESINANTVSDIAILHNGKQSIFNCWCGKGWKTNFHQFLIKEESDNLFDDEETSNKFTYVNGQGNHFIFEEKYYYIKDGKKLYVDSSEVTIADSDNNLVYIKDYVNYDVFREATSNNMIISSANNDDFKNYKSVQRYNDEILNLELEIQEIENVLVQCENTLKINKDSVCLIDEYAGISEKSSALQDLTIEKDKIEINLQKDLIALQNTYDAKEAEYNGYMEEILFPNTDPSKTGYDEAKYNEKIKKQEMETAAANIKTRTYIASRGANGTANGDGTIYYSDEIRKASDELRNKNYNYSVNSAANEKNKLSEEERLTNIRKEEYTILLENKKFELKELKKCTPVYYLSDGSGMILGFAPTESDNIFRLVTIFDLYENKLTLKYKNNKIDTITDNKDKVIKFKYNDRGLLEKIIDFNSKSISFEYKEDNILLSKIKYEDGNSSTYYYDNNNKLAYIISPSGYGYHLTYQDSRAIGISEITTANKIEKSVIDNVQDGNLIPNTNIKYLSKCGLEIEYYDYKHTIVTDLSSNKSVSYLFDKYGKIVTMYDNKFENGSVVGNVDVKSYDRSSDKKCYIIQPLPYSKNFLEGSGFNNSIVSEFILGEDLLCGDDIYLTSYICEEGDGDSNNIFVLNSSNPTISKFVKDEYIKEINDSNISGLVLSGWAKADSAWVDRKCTIYDLEPVSKQIDSDYFHKLIFDDNDDYRNDRKFELKAKLTYIHNISETESKEFSEEQFCSFDWMNTKWQYCAFPVIIKRNPTYILKSIEVSFDYKNNTGEAQFSNMELRKGNWEYYESDDDGNIIYYETSKDNTKINYEYEDKKLINESITINDVQYINKYYYNTNGALTRKISYDGLIEENIYNDKGKIIKSYTYHTNNPITKLYTTNVILDESGNVLYELDGSGNNLIEYKYKENTNIVTETKDSYGNKTNFGYSLENYELCSIGTNILGKNNYNKCVYNFNLMTGLWHNNSEFGFIYDGYGNVIETRINDESLFSIKKEDIIGKQLQESGEYKDIVTGEKITKELATGEIFVIYKNETGVVYCIEYYKNEESDVEVVLKNQIDLKGNIITSKEGITIDKITNKEHIKVESIYSYKEDGTVETLEYLQDGKKIIITSIEEDNNNITKKIVIDGETREDKYVYTGGLNRYLKEIHLFNEKVVSQKIDELGRVESISVDNHDRSFEYLQIGDSSTGLVTDEWYSQDIDGVKVKTENLNYRYDNKGNIVEIRENGNLRVKYEYDSASRLVREDNFYFNETYLIEYDVGGNIIRKRRLPLTNDKTNDICDVVAIDYLYRTDGWNDQLISYNGEFFKYDKVGNPTVYRNNSLKWTRGSLLDNYIDSKSNLIYKYEYDSNGNRIAKITEKNGKVDVKTNFYLDGSRIIAQDNGNLLYFNYGVDGIIGFSYSGVGEFFYKKNIQGDIVGIYDEMGAQIVKYEYDAWGNHKIKILLAGNYIDVNELESTKENFNASIANLNPFRYRGYYFDTETNLYYCNSRYYSPEMGRFISPDSIEYLDFESINGLNLYCYCYNNPVNYSDESGHLPKWLRNVFIVGAGVVLIAGLAVATIATGGAAAGVVGAIAAGALKGALIGAAIGTIAGGAIGYAVGGVDGMWTGMAIGFTGGAVIGAVIGGSIGYSTTKVHSVYISKTDDVVTYVGRTNNISRRTAEHALGNRGVVPQEVANKLTLKQARGLEQALIEKYGMIKNGGTLLNRINSISASNPIYTKAVSWGAKYILKILQLL